MPSVPTAIRPGAADSRVVCRLFLAEPNTFLFGFEHDEHGAPHEGQSEAALLRGRLEVNVSKAAKIKSVELKLAPCVHIERPKRMAGTLGEVSRDDRLKPQVVTFFNAMDEGWQTVYGNHCTFFDLNKCSAVPSGPETPDACGTRDPTRRPTSQTPADTDKEVASRDVERQCSSRKRNNRVLIASRPKGFRIFPPGTYNYSFELPVSHNQIESIKQPHASVQWKLEATVHRAAMLVPKTTCTREVPIIRLPDQTSLEHTEPIFINRQWENQLHYEILVSGKGFPIGSKVPIAIKVTPLGKVQVQKLEISITESIQYWTKDGHDTKRDPSRKVRLFEKVAGKPLDPAWASSKIETMHGGEPDIAERSETGDDGRRRRSFEGLLRSQPEPAQNLLGDPDLGLGSLLGPTEMEGNVQIPTCEMAARNCHLKLHSDCTWGSIQVHHWLEISMIIRRSKDNGTTSNKQSFRIQASAPVSILDCRASQPNTNLPAYSGSTGLSARFQSTCGCPDATPSVRDTSLTSFTSTRRTFGARNSPPLNATVNGHASSSHTNVGIETASSETRGLRPGSHTQPRLIHWLRPPSFGPPAFDEDKAPPATAEAHGDRRTNILAASPPPQYDVVVGTPSWDGLADYFARRSEHSHRTALRAADRMLEA